MKTQVLERLLEAITPSLGAELDRVIEELHRKLELESKERLEAALREAETTTQVAGRAQLEQAMTGAREEIRKEIHKEVAEKLEQEYKKALDETAGRLRSEAAAEHTRLQEQIDHWRVLAEAQQQLTQASSQAEILARLLRLGEPFAAGLAIYVAMDDGFALWKSRGEAVFPETLSGDGKNSEFYFKVIVVRGKTVAAVCAAQPYKVESLEFLVSSLEVSLEVFGLKLKSSMAKQSPVVEVGNNESSHLSPAQPPAST